MNLFTIVYWIEGNYLRTYLGTESISICWPLLTFCRSWHGISKDLLVAIVATLIIPALIVILTFSQNKNIRVGYWAIWLILVCECLLVLSDFRFRKNQHYMIFWVTFIFLAWPCKRQTLPLLIGMFYFWAGVIKLNYGWLSGNNIYRSFYLLPPEYVPLACKYVVFLELVAVWGLFSKNNFLFWFCFLQFVLFHILSWPIVGFFYPTVMLTLILAIPIFRTIRLDSNQTSSAQDSTTLKHSTVAIIGVFCCLQMIPKIIPGDSAITGEGRMWALHMFDGITVCEGSAINRYPDGHSETESIVAGWDIRIACDPIQFWNLGQNLCHKKLIGKDNFVDFDLKVRIRFKSESDEQYRNVIDISGFCEKKIKYNPFFHNDWISTAP